MVTTTFCAIIKINPPSKESQKMADKDKRIRDLGFFVYRSLCRSFLLEHFMAQSMAAAECVDLICYMDLDVAYCI